MARDDYYMGSLAGLDAYRGDEPAWPQAPSPWADFMSRDQPLPSHLLERPRTTAEKVAGGIGHLPADIVRGFVGTPQAIMQPNPNPEGSEEWFQFERSRNDALHGWGIGTGFGMTTGGVLAGGAKGNTLGSAGGRVRQPSRMGEVAEPNPRATIGSNMPPEEFALKPGDFTVGSVAELPPPTARITVTPEQPMGALADLAGPTPPAKPPTPMQEWMRGLPRPRPEQYSTDIPSIRGLPARDAIAIARMQPHLIKAGDQSEGFYVGGPRELGSKAGLNKIRADYDAYAGADPRGWDWYDRYRPALNLSTGGVPAQNQFAAAQHGQWSAGVDPGMELHSVLKEVNSSIAGAPEKAARPAQHLAHLNAVAANDPRLYRLGDKTDKYREEISRGLPGGAPLIQGATGVTDFRNLRQWGYTEPGGEAQTQAPGPAAHRFVDMETALAVDRANRMNLGGRSDWIGEQLQAAPWVRQKALDIQMRGGRNEDGSFKLSYDEAFQRANRTIADYYPEKTYNATHEAQPGADTGHLPQSVGAPEAERQAYFQDPGSTWATAPLPEGVTGPGRDAIYAGLGTPGTGNFMRVLPSVPMTGVYTPKAGVRENNLGEIARPMGTFSTPPEVDKNFIGPQPFVPFKQATAGDRAIMDAGEYFRAWMDAQNAGSWHKTWAGGPANQSNSLFYPRATPGRAALGDLFAMEGVGAPRGLPDVTDSAGGSLLTRFWPHRDYLPPDVAKDFNTALRKGEFAIPGQGEPVRVRVDSSLADLVDEWKQGEGSGAATRKMLEHVTSTPELRAAFNNNPYIADRALAKFERDKQWAGRWGAPRQDIQNARMIVGAGPGWIDRVEDALRTGAISLPAVAALLAGAAAVRQEDAGHGGL